MASLTLTIADTFCAYYRWSFLFFLNPNTFSLIRFSVTANTKVGKYIYFISMNSKLLTTERLFERTI